MRSSPSLCITLILAATASAGCATAPGASAQQLQTRAVFDLGCPHQQIMVYHVDGRTKAVAGCGRRLVYVESCQQIRGHHECTWVLDTPTFAQAQWPEWQRSRHAPTPVRRPVATDLFEPRATATPTPQPPPQPPPQAQPESSPPAATAAGKHTATTTTPGSARRPHSTDLFEAPPADTSAPPGRTIPIDLFDHQ